VHGAGSPGRGSAQTDKPRRNFPAFRGLPLARRAQQRQAYRLVELERWRAATGVELRLHPKHFPADDRLAARCILAALDIAGLPAAQKLTAAFLRMVWAEDRDIANESSLREVIEAQKLPSDRILAEADSPEVVAQYLANTREAIEAQVFGVPWYVFEGIPYWGQDRLDFLERAFAGTLPKSAPG